MRDRRLLIEILERSSATPTETPVALRLVPAVNAIVNFQGAPTIPGKWPISVYHRTMTWRTRRMMRRSRPRVVESHLLASSISILWTAVAVGTVLILAVGLFLHFPGTNAIDNPVVVLP